SRLVLCLLAALQPLQAYPVAGSQISFGTLLLIPAAVTCLGDVLSDLDRLLSGCQVLTRALRVVGPLASAVAVILLADNARQCDAAYQAAVPLGLRGSERLRLDERDVARIRWLVANLERHCDTFLCTVGHNSLYFWADKEPPSRIVIGNEINILTRKQQRTLVATLDRAPRPCIVDHENLFDKYAVMFGRPKPQRQSELLNYAAREYVSCGEVDGYSFKVKNWRPVPRLVECARWHTKAD